MPSKVYYIDLRAKYDQSLPDKLSRLVVAAGMDRIVKKRDLVAVKLHFGELGNTAFIRPLFLRRIVDVIRASGGEAFLTDANTLYAGSRGNAVAHMATAVSNGFAYSVVQAPLIIADGLRGKSQAAVSIKQRHNQVAYIGREIVEADSLVAVAHFKGHELCGFGGTLKNLGMGCASRRGKMAQHANLGPKIKRKKCVGCGACAAHCSQGAIQLNAVPNGPNSETNSEVNSEMKATIAATANSTYSPIIHQVSAWAAALAKLRWVGAFATTRVPKPFIPCNRSDMISLSFAQSATFGPGWRLNLSGRYPESPGRMRRRSPRHRRYANP